MHKGEKGFLLDVICAHFTYDCDVTGLEVLQFLSNAKKVNCTLLYTCIYEVGRSLVGFCCLKACFRFPFVRQKNFFKKSHNLIQTCTHSVLTESTESLILVLLFESVKWLTLSVVW